MWGFFFSINILTMYGLSQITQPAVEPVTLAQAKEFLTISSSVTVDDALIISLISAARFLAESYTRRAFFNQQWLLTLDHFPMLFDQSSIKNISDSAFPYDFYFQGNTIQIPKPKCVTVDSIQYLDVVGDVQTMDSSTYVLDNKSQPARVIPVSNVSWPTVAFYVPGSVQITFTAGSYGDGIEVNTCPQNVVTAISLLTAHFFGNREGGVPIPDAFYRLLDPVKFVTFGYSSY
jgi:hypothetical protein